MSKLYFCLGKNKELALKIFENPEPTETVEFRDGELWIRGIVDVGGKDVVCVHTLQGSVNGCIVELLIFLEWIKSKGPQRVTVILPYFFYGRQDRDFEEGCSVAARWFIGALENVGADRLVTVDVHSPRIAGFCRTMEMVCLDAAEAMADALGGCKGDVVVAPDKGSIGRAKSYARRMGLETVVVDKRRTKGGLELELMEGDVVGRRCFVVDDILDTGGTMFGVVRLLKDKGAREIVVAVTHPLFSDNALDRLREMYGRGLINGVFVTNSIPRDLDDFVGVVDLSGLLSNAI